MGWSVCRLHLWLPWLLYIIIHTNHTKLGRKYIVPASSYDKWTCQFKVIKWLKKWLPAVSCITAAARLTLAQMDLHVSCSPTVALWWAWIPPSFVPSMPHARARPRQANTGGNVFSLWLRHHLHKAHAAKGLFLALREARDKSRFLPHFWVNELRNTGFSFHALSQLWRVTATRQSLQTVIILLGST